MDKKELVEVLQARGLTDIIELIEDAEKGDLEELELVESIGLLYDDKLNREVIALLEQLGVKIIYVTDEDDEVEEE